MNVEDLMTDLVQRFGADGLDRVEESLAVLTGQRPPDYLHDEQEATRLFFPGISALPWHDTAGLDWVAHAEGSYDDIVREFRALRSEAVPFSPYEDSYTKELGWQGWDTYTLYRNGEIRPEAKQRCPITLEVLEQTPHGPRDGMFTVLNPGVHITPHSGGVNLLLTCHLALDVPPGCSITVAGDERGWTEGRCVLFDDSFIHEAVNRGSEQRAVLLWDVWHPELTAVEIAAISYLMPTFRQYLTVV